MNSVRHHFYCLQLYRYIVDLTMNLALGTMNVNAMAHFWTCKAFLPSMIQRDHGHIVSIASLAGKVFRFHHRVQYTLYMNRYTNLPI